MIRESEKEVPTLFFWVWVVDNDFIDQFGIKRSTHEAMKRALKEISRKIPDEYEIHSILIDGNDHFTFPDVLPKDPVSIICGDQKVKEIAGASIIAKVFRDRLMETYSILHPKLRVEKHKWYGTDAHISTLNHDSITSFHRLSFAPVKAVLKQKPQLLLHVCCGPDATVPILDLKEKYDILAFWYDPNIHPRSEYEKRKQAFAQVCEIEGVRWIEWPYDVKEFFRRIRGFERTEERGEKCKKCYDFRLEYAAKVAKEHGIPFFTTTLAISPHKDLDCLFRIGEIHGNRSGVTFLPIPFRKQSWFERSVAYTEKHGIYRQSYCGCVFSEWFPPLWWEKGHI